jgi:hypothetical protein
LCIAERSGEAVDELLVENYPGFVEGIIRLNERKCGSNEGLSKMVNEI